MSAEAMDAWSAQDEFKGIMTVGPEHAGNRPVMSRPPRYIATKDFVREVAVMLERDNTAEAVADWAIDKMERFGALMAEPMFTMGGVGPICSWWKELWPLCGHQHQSQRIHEPDIADGVTP